MYVKTIQAMKRIEEIKEKQDLRFYRNRKRIAKMSNINEVKNTLKKHVTLIHDKKVKARIEDQISKEEQLKKEKLKKLQKLVVEENSNDENNEDSFDEESIENEA